MASFRKTLAAWLDPSKANPAVVQPHPQASDGSFAFYDEKSRTVPRFLYRRLAAALEAAPDMAARETALADFLATLETEGAKGDYQKFKWVMPAFLRRRLQGDEEKRLDDVLQARRERRNRRMMEVYPHCADEFSLEPSFFDAVFPTPSKPLLTKTTRVFTIGSCFARNIAVFLQSKGYNAEAFVQAEDLNSPLSNAKMLAVAVASEAEQRAYLSHWVETLYPDEGARRVEKEMERLRGLVASIAAADVLILTIGNTLDFFLEEASGPALAPEVPVAPKFFGVSDTEDLEKRQAVGSRLKRLGATFRLARYGEAQSAVQTFTRLVRQINPSAPCLITLSPVPMDSAVGLVQSMPYGSLEIDCISKSTLRSVLFELFEETSREANPPLYFPSYEIVRWVGSMLGQPVFGAEDAASRHVSAALLSSVYALFLRRFAVTEAS